MEDEKKAEFTKRQSGSIPVICGNRPQDTVHRTVVTHGDCVTLHIDSELVQVNDVEVLGNGQFRGRIHGFDPTRGLGYRGHKLEDIVDFEEANIWALIFP